MPARLIEELWISGYSEIPSGSVRFFQPGTTNPVVVYSNDLATTVLTQPVPLDANGKSTSPIYVTVPARAIFYDVSGAQVLDVERIDGDRAELVNVTSVRYPGNPSVLQVLEMLAISLGGINGNFAPGVPGAVGRPVSTVIAELSLSVKSMGALGNGIADDSAAIQATYDAVASAGGGEVYYPPGIYQISTPITLTGKTGVSSRGAGAFASKIRNTNTGADAFTFTSCVGFQILDLGVTHATTSTGAALDFVNCTGVHLDGFMTDPGASTGTHKTGVLWLGGGSLSTMTCQIYGNGATAVAVSASGGSLSFFNTNLVGDGTVNGTGINITGTGYGLIQVIGCVFSGMATGMNFAASYTVSPIAVVGNTFFGSINPIVSPSTTANLYTGTNIIGNSGNIGGYTTTVLSGATVTPDRNRGPEIRIVGTTTGAAYVVAAPTPPLSIGNDRNTLLVLHFFNSAGGAVTGWTMDPIYHINAAIISTVNNEHTELTLRWDADAGVWREASRAVST